jgi:hypothetical protein
VTGIWWCDPVTELGKGARCCLSIVSNHDGQLPAPPPNPPVINHLLRCGLPVEPELV